MNLISTSLGTKGTTRNFYGYGGNEVMNKWFDTYVVDQMKEKRYNS